MSDQEETVIDTAGDDSVQAVDTDTGTDQSVKNRFF